MMNEEAGFRHKINQEPFEPIHHLAYADWLDDNGFSGEAEIRRGYGHWLSEGQAQGGWLNQSVKDAWRDQHRGLYNLYERTAIADKKAINQQRLQRRANALRFARR